MSKTVELIKQDHRKAEELFTLFRQTPNAELAEQICVELTVHARLEEEMLYPLLDQKVNHEEAEHAQEEHDEAKQLIMKIQEGDAEDKELFDLVTQLEKVITHHVQEEESEILPEMEDKLGTQLEGLFAAVIERKEMLMEEEQPDPEMLDLNKEELHERVKAMLSSSS